MASIKTLNLQFFFFSQIKKENYKKNYVKSIYESPKYSLSVNDKCEDIISNRSHVTNSGYLFLNEKLKYITYSETNK